MRVNAPASCGQFGCEPRKHRKLNLLPYYDSTTQTRQLVTLQESGLPNLPMLQGLPYEVRFLIAQCLDFPTMAKMAVLSKATLKIVRPILQGLVNAYGVSTYQGAQAFSSALTTSSYGATQSLMAFDQVDFSRLRALVGTPPGLTVAYGSVGKGDSRGMTTKEVVPVGGKMHNKFAVFRMPTGNYVTFTGSPNISKGAMTGLNVESALVIDGPQVGYLFKQYHGLLMGNPTQEALRAFGQGVNALNASGGPVRIAFAPFQNVADFVAAEIAGADSVLVRMFLISPKYKIAKAGDGSDPSQYDEPFLNSLITLSKAGASVCVVLDRNNYDNTQKKTGFVGDAAKYVTAFAPKAKFYVETGFQMTKRGPIGIMHDKLILVRKGTRYKVLLGSSGMTTNNYDQSNYENMIALDGQGAYEHFLQLHNSGWREEAVIPDSFSKKWKL
ncbi:phospholipase D-like domain-containing protein [Hyalangium rubrum]|uniref:Phospholipase D-like domain-containing protein n=1 Tax=Hyalangium rubrum TaxID=3103134 RepID=A0ABU5H9P0_9BACT|nr:phospholipase D-like domain-containing protein [Hyalangium sp. s54d21]MDY7229543.1 phospholipase D-like domain-containing protein [Hyalangium sp. s54d21]